MKNYEVLNELVPKTQELHRAVFDKGYEQGVNDGSLDVKMRVDGAYEKGLNDAWECARKIIVLDEPMCVVGGTGLKNFICNHSVSEAIAKIKEYEEKKNQADNEIKVGDEVVDGKVFNSGKGIVTFASPYPSPVILYILWYDGSTGRRKITDVKKTGRTFSEISEFLEQLKEENK